ncbi:MAG: single-stranded DNA-binding protein [Alistipes sp.]|jgi:single-strand DNA-binding protein|nr:single-stranded DNA-binding protein [Alistipes sp.]
MINKVILVGNVGADPEIRTLETGVKVARVRLATTERIFNRQTQETKEHTEWHSVVLWRGLADVADKYVRKGSQIYIEGPLRSNEWTDKEGIKRYGVEIVANDLKLLGRRGEGGSSSGGSSGGSGGSGYGAGASGASGASAGGAATNAYPAAGAGAAPQPAATSDPDPIPVDDPDDLPF